MTLKYGFQRLVLLGSAGYQRAELPWTIPFPSLRPTTREKQR